MALIVDYGGAGERTYRKGDSLVEAFETPHQLSAAMAARAL